MTRYKGIQLLEYDSDPSNFDVEPTTEMIHMLDKYREKTGHSDLVSDANNDVYYTFYLEYDTKIQECNLYGIVNHSMKDDYMAYEFPMMQSEKTYLLFKVIERLEEILSY